MGLIDKITALLRPVSVRWNLKNFRNDLIDFGFNLQETNPASYEAKSGLKYFHIIPDDLWANICSSEYPLHDTNDGKERHITIVCEPTNKMNGYLNFVYVNARNSADKYGLEPILSEPRFVAGG